jgi:hypothetical protein
MLGLLWKSKEVFPATIATLSSSQRPEDSFAPTESPLFQPFLFRFKQSVDLLDEFQKPVGVLLHWCLSA